MLPDFIVTPIVIAILLFVAWKTEWCARQAWRILRVVLPLAAVVLEALLLVYAPVIGVFFLLIAIIAGAYYLATNEKRRQMRALALWKSRLIHIEPPAADSESRKS